MTAAQIILFITCATVLAPARKCGRLFAPQCGGSFTPRFGGSLSPQCGAHRATCQPCRAIRWQSPEGAKDRIAVGVSPRSRDDKSSFFSLSSQAPKGRQNRPAPTGFAPHPSPLCGSALPPSAQAKSHRKSGITPARLTRYPQGMNTPTMTAATHERDALLTIFVR